MNACTTLSEIIHSRTTRSVDAVAAQRRIGGHSRASASRRRCSSDSMDVNGASAGVGTFVVLRAIDDDDGDSSMLLIDVSDRTIGGVAVSTHAGVRVKSVASGQRLGPAARAKGQNISCSRRQFEDSGVLTRSATAGTAQTAPVTSLSHGYPSGNRLPTRERCAKLNAWVVTTRSQGRQPDRRNVAKRH